MIGLCSPLILVPIPVPHTQGYHLLWACPSVLPVMSNRESWILGSDCVPGMPGFSSWPQDVHGSVQGPDWDDLVSPEIPWGLLSWCHCVLEGWLLSFKQRTSRRLCWAEGGTTCAKKLPVSEIHCLARWEPPNWVCSFHVSRLLCGFGGRDGGSHHTSQIS